MTGETKKGGKGWESIWRGGGGGAEGSSHRSSYYQHYLGTCVTKPFSISTSDVPQGLVAPRGCLVKMRLRERAEMGQQGAEFGGGL